MLFENLRYVKYTMSAALVLRTEIKKTRRLPFNCCSDWTVKLTSTSTPEHDLSLTWQFLVLFFLLFLVFNFPRPLRFVPFVLLDFFRAGVEDGLTD